MNTPLLTIPRIFSALAVTVVLMVPSESVAGEYHAYGCRLPDGNSAPTDGWRINQAVDVPPLEQTNPPTLGVGDPSWQGWVRSCAAGGSFGAVVDDSTITAAGGARHAALRFEPGAGISITRGVIYRALSSYNAGRAEIIYPRETSTPSEGLVPTAVLDSTSGNASTGNAGVPLWPANRFDFPVSDGKGGLAPAHAVPRLDLVVSCGPAAPCSGASAQLFRTDLVLNDPAGPTVDLVAGTVVEQGVATTRILKGNESVTIAASDPGVGVDQFRVEIDGSVFAQGQLRGAGGSVCNWAARASDGLPAATAVRPCPATGSGTLALDTTKVPDGAHQLRVLAVDGSGSESVAAAGRVLVRNTDVVGAGSPDEFRGVPNGSGTVAQLTAGWTVTAKPASKRKSIQRKCKKPSYRRKHEISCFGRPARAKIVRDWSSTQSTEISGRAAGATGTPVSAATLDVTAVGPDGTRSALGTVQTDELGTFRTRVSFNAGSRTIEVSWRERTGDTVVANRAQVDLQVKAGSTFKSSGVRAGGRATFSGRIVAGDLVNGGASIRLQYLVGGRWTNFDTAATDNNGRWSVSRRLTQRTTYRMRVVVDDSPRRLFEGLVGRGKLVRVL